MPHRASQQDGELRPGDVCDGYRIVGLIAAGGMGDVYEAVHESTGRTVALKCLKLQHRAREDARSRMKMEAVLLSELRHANLVQVYDAGVTELDTIWIAMERLHGQTLRDLLLRSGRLTIPDALYYASEIADGVNAVHEANVIHRDLKPENVFITDRKLVKVLDLGTGKFTGYGLKSTDGARIVGTTAYMAPEQIKGLRVDGRADVYALGLMVYEMVAGRHPLADGLGRLPRAIEQVALLQLQSTPKALSGVAPVCPPYLSMLVGKAIAKDRDQRQASMSAFSSDLRAARKRFIAENRLDESAVDLRAASDALRVKLGAPPRQTPSPPSSPPSGSTPPSEPRDTELRGPPEFTLDGATPFHPRDPTVDLHPREPTLELSISVSSLAPGTSTHDRPPSVERSNEMVNLATRTNPLGVPRLSDPIPQPRSLPDGRRRGGLRGRRLALTLGLGALIGVPPALFGVLWWTSHQREIAEAEPQPAPNLPVELPSAIAGTPATAVATPGTPATAVAIPGTPEVAVATPTPTTNAPAPPFPSTAAPPKVVLSPEPRGTLAVATSPHARLPTDPKAAARSPAATSAPPRTAAPPAPPRALPSSGL